MNQRFFNLNGKVAVVTGASRGIGRAIAIGLAQAGADVVVTSRTLSLLQEVAAEIEKVGRKSLVVPADISKPEDINHMVAQAVKEFDRIDILVNNAGVSPNMVRAENLSKEEWDKVIATNLTGAFLCAQAVGRVMIQQGGGKIINVTSVLGTVANPRLLAYCVAKGGINQLTKALAIDWLKYNIQVNAIGPGWVETDMTQSLKESKTVYDDLVRKIPIGRFGEPQEMVGAAIFLASDESNYMTGQTIYVDGGYLAL